MSTCSTTILSYYTNTRNDINSIFNSCHRAPTVGAVSTPFRVAQDDWRQFQFPIPSLGSQSVCALNRFPPNEHKSSFWRVNLLFLPFFWMYNAANWKRWLLKQTSTCSCKTQISQCMAHANTLNTRTKPVPISTPRRAFWWVWYLVARNCFNGAFTVACSQSWQHHRGKSPQKRFLSASLGTFTSLTESTTTTRSNYF